MKPLDTTLGRGNIVDSHLQAGRNVLPKEWEEFLCLIPNNKPFLYNNDGTTYSLHTLLTSPCFDFANLYELSEQEQSIFGQIEAFCTILYTAHKILNNEYVSARVIKLEEKSTFPQFHMHFSLAENEETIRTSISESTNLKARGVINEDELHKVIGDLQHTRDRLLDVENKDIFDTTGTNLSKKAQELYTQITDQIATLFN